MHKLEIARRLGFFFDVLRVSMGKIAALLAFFATNFFIARYLGPEGKGLAAIFTVIPHLLVAIAIFGMDKSANFVLGKRVYGEGQVVAALMWTAVLSLLFGGLIGYFYFALTWTPQHNAMLVWMTIGIALVEIVQRLASGVMLGKEMIGAYSLTRWVPFAIQAIYVAIIAIAATLSVNDVIFGALLGVVLTTIYSFINLGRVMTETPSYNRACHSVMARYGFAVFLGEIVVMGNYKVQIFILQFLGTTEQVGLYAMGQNFSELLWQFSGAISAVILSRSANAADEEAFSRKVGVATRLALYGGLLCAIGIAVVCHFMIPFVFGREFSMSATVVWIMVPGMVLMLAFQILATDLAGRGRPMIGVMLVAPAAALNVALGIALAPEYGVVGATAAASISYFLLGVVSIIVYCRVSGMAMGRFVTMTREDVAFIVRRLPLDRFKRRP